MLKQSLYSGIFRMQNIGFLTPVAKRAARKAAERQDTSEILESDFFVVFLHAFYTVAHNFAQFHA